MNVFVCMCACERVCVCVFVLYTYLCIYLINIITNIGMYMCMIIGIHTTFVVFST